MRLLLLLLQPDRAHRQTLNGDLNLAIARDHDGVLLFGK